MRGSWEEARTYSCCDFATRIAMSRAVGTWELMVWRSCCEREPHTKALLSCHVDCWKRFHVCGINEYRNVCLRRSSALSPRSVVCPKRRGFRSAPRCGMFQRPDFFEGLVRMRRPTICSRSGASCGTVRLLRRMASAARQITGRQVLVVIVICNGGNLA